MKLGRVPHNKLPIGTIEGLSSFSKGLGLDPGIRRHVEILRSQGVETCQSCEGGGGHSYPEPTVDFFGNHAEDPRALSVALNYGLPVLELRRKWDILDGEMVGPIWSMTFRPEVRKR